MGKIRVAKLGDESQEQKQRDKRLREREEKKKREKVHLPGMKGGERAVAMTGEDEVERLAKISEDQEKLEKEFQTGVKEEEKGKKAQKRERSKSYKFAALKVDRAKTYTISEALELLKQINLTKFDATVELHINTLEKGLRGAVAYPHGTGKTLRIIIITSTGETASENGVTVGGDELVDRIAAGWTDFDIVVAHPAMMPKLAKVARILGPRGLMPNPKAGTISPNPEAVAKKLAGGQVQFKTEGEFPIIHQIIGKMSFEDKKLEENFKALITAIGPTKIKSLTLKSTMSPGIRVAVS